MHISVYTALARKLGWDAKGDWIQHKEEQIDQIMRTAPHGAGICCLGITDDSKPERMVFEFSYHHTDDENPRSYGYTDHKVIVKPCPQFGFTMKVIGWEGDYRTYGTRDYLGDTFHHWLSSMVEEHAENYERSFYKVCRDEYDAQHLSSARRNAGILERGIW